ncbi:hypothetical protein CLV56_1640 [Mumia flava]|uniref:DUF4386 family protein n=1 Tax=Mumia flava TaxID=1348852 RepID=A0A2M9BHJ4_9ACTN|nr:hypothetical protein [Mumia flava]PJJ57411.1 hypothetical protein CLV56_1640 [Mumia flava]
MKDPTTMGEVFLADPPAGDRRDERDPGSERGAGRPKEAPRAWAFTGVAAALCGLFTVVVSGGLWDPDLDYSDPVAIAERLADAQGQLIAMHVATTVGMVLMVVFALGLARRVAAATPKGSLIGGVAASGLGLVAVASLLGSGLDTEFLFATEAIESDVPEVIAFYNHWIATIPWLWIGAGLAGVALAVAGRRHGAVPRWIGITGAVLGGLTLVAGISPLQYMAGFSGPVWLLVTAIGFAVGDRAFRKGTRTAGTGRADAAAGAAA